MLRALQGYGLDEHDFSSLTRVSRRFLYLEYACQIRPSEGQQSPALLVPLNWRWVRLLSCLRGGFANPCRCCRGAGIRLMIMFMMAQKALNEIQVITPREACRPRKNAQKARAKPAENPGFDKALRFSHKHEFIASKPHDNPVRIRHFPTGNVDK